MQISLQILTRTTTVGASFHKKTTQKYINKEMKINVLLHNPLANSAAEVAAGQKYRRVSIKTWLKNCVSL